MNSAKRAVQREARIATLRLVQDATDASGTHQVTVELDDGANRWSATAEVRLGLNQVELDRLRWYLEDYPQYPIDPAPEIAAQVEGRLVELGRELFRQVFNNQEATQLWDRAEPGLLDDGTAIAEWEATFDVWRREVVHSLVNPRRIDGMDGVAGSSVPIRVVMSGDHTPIHPLAGGQPAHRRELLRHVPIPAAGRR